LSNECRDMMGAGQAEQQAVLKTFGCYGFDLRAGGRAR
jgi:hypothetical protein